jgi:hypothetical protein
MNQIQISDDVIDFLQSHLKQELKLLDVAIDSAKEVREILRVRRGVSKPSADDSPSKPETDSGEALSSTQDQARLLSLQNDIARSAGPIVDSRKELAAVLAAAAPEHSSPSLRQVAAGVAEPAKSQLLRLRTEVREKLTQFQAISMSNQTVLVYSLDYYSQLLGGSNQTSGYDASGQAAKNGVSFRYNQAG